MTQKPDSKQLSLIHGYCRRQSNNMNIVDGIIYIIYEYQRLARWSKIHKGDKIKVSEEDTRAECIEDHGHSVTADFCIDRGQIVSWEFECYQFSYWSYFYGVISSKQTDFNMCPDEELQDAYGVDDDYNMIYLGDVAVDIEEQATLKGKWIKPEFPIKKIYKLQMTADWRVSNVNYP